MKGHSGYSLVEKEFMIDLKLIEMVESVTQGQIDDFAEKLEPKPFNKGEYHEVQEKKMIFKHELQTYKMKLPIADFDIEVKWNYCPECSETRNQKVSGFDPNTQSYWDRDLIKHGNDVEEPTFEKRIEEIKFQYQEKAKEYPKLSIDQKITRRGMLAKTKRMLLEKMSI